MPVKISQEELKLVSLARLNGFKDFETYKNQLYMQYATTGSWLDYLWSCFVHLQNEANAEQEHDLIILVDKATARCKERNNNFY